MSQLAGQAHLIAGARPIDRVLADPATPPRLAERLVEAEEIVAFARASGFRVGDAYRTYADPPDGVPVWIVSACPPDRLEPVTWSFPLVGAFPYKGFFRREIAEAEVCRLRDEGLEVDLRPARAYSTLGWFSDPVLPAMLVGDAGERAGIILHELAHRTVFVPGDARLNESVATSIEDGAVETWLVSRGLDDVLTCHRARERDRERLRVEVERTIAALEEGFRAEERVARLAARDRALAGFRERLAAADFESERYSRLDTWEWSLPALLLLDVYGGDGPLLDALWEASGRSIERYLEFLAEAAAAPEPRMWIAERAGVGAPPDAAGAERP